MAMQPNEERNRMAVVLQPGEQLADTTWYKPGKVDVILGVGTVLSLLTGPSRTMANMLVVPTRLGMLVAGASQIQSQAATEAICAMSLAGEGKDELLEALRNLWEIDEIFEESMQSPEGRWCEEEFSRTVAQDEEGRYIATIPIRPGKVWVDQENRRCSVSSVWKRKFARDTAYQEWYVEYMRALFKAGYLQEVLGPVPEGKPSYYIPHHGVRPSKKPRVVFDASAKTSTGKSGDDGGRAQDVSTSVGGERSMGFTANFLARERRI